MSAPTGRPVPQNMADRLIVALDVPTIAEARAMVQRIGDAAGVYKVGYWLLYSPGADGLLMDIKAAGKRLFLDAKLHDIGQTVEIGAARAAERGVDLNIHRLWVIDGSKALRSGIDQLCGEAAHVQRCRIHKIRNVTERLPKDAAAQTRWVMAQAFKGEAEAGIHKLRAHAKHLKAQHPDAASSLLEGLEELFTINRLGVTGELARCLATTNVIESPNSAVRRVSGRVTRYRDAQIAMRWVAAGFLEAEKGFRRLRGHDRIPALIRALRPVSDQMKKAA